MKLSRPILSAAVAALALVALIIGTVRATHPRALAAQLFGGSDQHRITAVVARDKPSVVAIEVISQSADPQMPDLSDSVEAKYRGRRPIFVGRRNARVGLGIRLRP